jgi:TonB family protein
MCRHLLLGHLVILVSLSLAVAQQAASPAVFVRPTKAIYSPAPVYRPEWAKQGLAGKGVVLVNIDTKTGGVTGVRMLQSTGSNLLDGAALEAYSKWRFEPGGTVSQVKMPIEFASRPPSQAARPAAKQTPFIYIVLVLLGFGAAMTLMRRRRG